MPKKRKVIRLPFSYLKIISKSTPSDSTTPTNSQSLLSEYIKCPLCFYRTKSVHIYRRHVSLHFAPRRFECFKCFPERYFCPHCSHRSVYTTKLYQHIQSKHPKDAPKIHEKCKDFVNFYICKDCKYRTNSQLLYVRHFRYCKEKAPPKQDSALRARYRCGFCTYVTFFPADFKSHMDTKHSRPVKWFECDLCPYKCQPGESFAKHCSEHGMSAMFKCSRCEYKGDSFAKYKGHLVKHYLPNQKGAFRSLSEGVMYGVTEGQKGGVEEEVIDLDDEEDEATSKVYLKCDLCTFQTEDEIDLVEHAMKCHIM